MRIASALLLCCALLAACDSYPKDIEGTLDRVQQTHVIRVGMAALDPSDLGLAKAYLARIEAKTGAKAQVTAGPTEILLANLEAGELDLVLGEFAEDSPWLDSAALIEPLGRRVIGERVAGLAPVAANGENRWIGVLERAVRDAKLSS